jgi:hypothetical protein
MFNNCSRSTCGSSLVTCRAVINDNNISMYSIFFSVFGEPKRDEQGSNP